MPSPVRTPSILATSIVGLLGLLAHQATAQTTGAFSSVLLGNGNFDAAIGLDSQKTYFNAYNVAGGALTINGVSFLGATPANPSAATFSTSGFGAAIAPGPGNAHAVTGTYGTLVNDFYYNGAAGAQTITLGGATPLTVGQTYTVTFYNRAWATGNRTQAITTTSGATINYNQDNGTQGQASLFRYTFVASGVTETITMNPLAGASFHLYGFSTEQVFNNNLVNGTDWTTATWSVATPNKAGANANFTAQGAPTTLNLNQNQTVGHLQFDGANAWTLSSTSNRILTLQGDAGGVSVLGAVSGTHTIANNLQLRSETVKMGNGTLRINGSMYGSQLALNVNGGTLELAGSNPRTGDTRVYTGATLVLKNTEALSGSVLDTQTGSVGTVVFDNSVGGGAFSIGGLKGNNGLSLQTNTAAPVALTVGGILGTNTFGGTLSGSGSLIKKGGVGVMILTGAQTFTGSTTLNGGTLRLAYAADNSMLSNTAPLNLNAGTLDLAGTVAHAEEVASTVLGGTAAITRSTGTSTINLHAISGPGTLAIGADNIATTDTLNSAAGILPGRITVNGNWAVNSTNAANGGIIALATYTDVPRLGGVINDGALTNVRIIESGTTGNVTLGAAGLTIINSLLQGATGTPATVDIGPGNTLRIASGDVLLPAGNGALTTTANGTLTVGAATDAPGVLTLQNQNTTNAITIAAAITDNGAGAVSLTKAGAGAAILSGTNSYSAGTTLLNGILSVGTDANLGGAATPITFKGGILQITGNAITNFDARTINASTFDGGIDVSLNTHNVTLNQTLSGSGNLIKAGAGKLTLTSTTNTNTGLLRMDGGLVNVASISDYGVPSSIGSRTLAQETAADDGIGLWFRGGGLEYTGSTPQSTNRNIRINAGANAVITASGSTPTATLSFTNSGPNINLFENGGARGVLLNGTNTGTNTFSMRLEEIGGVTNLFKQGPGTWYVNNDANAFTGTVQFGGGILNISSISDYGVPSSIGARTLAQESNVGENIGLWFRGGTLQYTGSVAQSTNRQIRILGSLTGGGVTNTIDASGSTPTATLSFTKTGANINLFDTQGLRTLNLTGTNTGANQFNISLTNQDVNATSLTKNGPGTWVLSPIAGANTSTYTGLTTINNGTLKITVDTALGSAAGGTLIAGGTTTTALLALENNITVTGEPLSLAGRSGASVLLPHLTNVTGSNTWTGNTTFDVGGNNYTLESQSGSLTVSGQVSGGATTGDRFFNVLGAGNGVISGNIINGSAVLNLTKTGTGSWTLSGANTYTGVTAVTNGTLALSGASTNSIPNSRLISVATGATLNTTGLTGGGVTLSSAQILAGTGTVAGGVTVSSGSLIAPGSGTIGTLTVGSLAFSNNGGGASFALGSPGNNSRVNSTGTLTLPTSGKPVLVNFINDNNVSGFGSLGNGTYQILNSTGLVNAFNANQFAIASAPNFKSYAFSQSGNAVNVTVGDGDEAFSAPGVFSRAAFTPGNQMTDTNIGLDLNKTYQNAVNINGGALNINNVPFAAGGVTAGTNWTLAGAGIAFPGPWANNLTGQIASLMSNFTYGGNPGVLTLSGLTFGQTYAVTLYGAGFGGVGGRIMSSVTTSDGGSLLNYDGNEGGAGNGNLLRYTFTATGATETLTLTPLQAGNTYHFYGFSNEQVFNNTWQSAGNGTWAGAAWANTGNTGAGGANPNIVPNYVGSNAVLPAQGVATNIDLDVDTTVGHVQFEGTNPWTISSTSGRVLTVQADAGATAVLNSVYGNHKIAVPTILQSDAVKIGAGTITFAAPVVANGKSLTVSTGTVQFGDGVTNASFDGNITNNSHVVFANTGGQAYPGVITGIGNLTKSGAGTLTLNGISTYTGRTKITAGTLQSGSSSSVLHLDLNGPAGNAVTNDPGAILDSSGNGRNGTLVGSGATYVAGPFGQAINFGGTSRVSVPVDAGMQLNTYTISTWFNLSDTTAMNGLFDTRNGGGNAFDLKVMPGTAASASVIHGDFGTGTGGWINTAADIGGLTILPNTWHMVTYVIDGANGLFSAYYDGVAKVSNQAFAGVPLFATGGSLFIGETTDGNSKIRGAMDEIYLYGQAFNASQITNLYLNSVGSLPTATPVSIATGATLDLSGRNQTVASLADTAFGQTGSVSNSATGTSVMFTLAPGAASATVFNGVISDGAGEVGLVLNGPGTQTLAGTNTYTGDTLVQAGTLVVDGSISGSATSVLGGTLGGSGTVGALILTSGVLAPGTGSGILSTIGTVGLNGGTFSLDITGTTVGTGYDQLNVTGSVAFNGLVALSLNLGSFNPADDGSQSFTIVNNDFSDPIGFDFGNNRAFTFGGNPLNEGSYFIAGTQEFQITYAGGSNNNDVVLIAVPEPTAMLSLLGSLGILMGMRRRRQP